MNTQKETQKAKKAPEKEEKDLKKSIDAPEDEKNGYKDAGLPEPTRYNDWEVKGRCSDF